MKKIIVLVLLLCVAGLAHAEMIVNGDFEAGLSGWTGNWGSGSGTGTAGYLWWSGSASVASSGGSDGGQYAVLDTTPMDGHMDSWGWVWQGIFQSDIPATAGQTLTIDGYASDLDAAGATSHLFLEWEDALGNRVDYDGDGAADDNNDDRSHLQFLLTGGGSWEQIATTYTVPTVDLLGNPFANPIAQFNAMWSIEAEAVKVGLDQLSIVTNVATNPYPPSGAINVPTTAVLEWDPPPTFTPLAYDVYLNTDPNVDKPEQLVVDHNDVTTYDPSPDLAYNTKYWWRVNAYDPCDVIRSPGAVWNFTTWPVEPVFTTDIGSATVEAGSSAQFYVQTPRSNTFQWYKEPSTPVNDGDGGGDVSVVTDATSSTLTIINVEQADEDYYYCVATGTGSTESNHARLLTKRLMGYWKFNGSLNDETPAGNNGTLTDPNVLNPPPGAPVFNAGIQGGSINLTGSEIYVDIPNQEYFNFHAQGFTVSAWIKTEQTGWGAIVTKTDRTAPRTGWLLHHNGDTAVITLRSPTAGDNDESTFNAGLADNGWHMLAGTYDADTGMLALYVDGEKQDEDGPFLTLTETDMALKIGIELKSDYLETDSVIDYDGWIDEVKIASYPWDGYEIAIEYTTHETEASVCVEPVPGDQNGDCVINTDDLVVVVFGLAGMWHCPA